LCAKICVHVVNEYASSHFARNLLETRCLLTHNHRSGMQTTTHSYIQVRCACWRCWSSHSQRLCHSHQHGVVGAQLDRLQPHLHRAIGPSQSQLHVCNDGMRVHAARCRPNRKGLLAVAASTTAVRRLPADQRRIRERVAAALRDCRGRSYGTHGMASHVGQCRSRQFPLRWQLCNVVCGGRQRVCSALRWHDDGNPVADGGYCTRRDLCHVVLVRLALDVHDGQHNISGQRHGQRRVGTSACICAHGVCFLLSFGSCVRPARVHTYTSAREQTLACVPPSDCVLTPSPVACATHSTAPTTTTRRLRPSRTLTSSRGTFTG
jgi:hypothetical protein